MAGKLFLGSQVTLPAILIFALHLSAIGAYSQTFEERVDRYINSFPRYEEFHGVVFAAAGGHVFINKGYGLANREFSIPNSPDSRSVPFPRPSPRFWSLKWSNPAGSDWTGQSATTSPTILRAQGKRSRSTTFFRTHRASAITLSPCPITGSGMIKFFTHPGNSSPFSPRFRGLTNQAKRSPTAVPASMFWVLSSSKSPKNHMPNFSANKSSTPWEWKTPVSKTTGLSAE